MIRPIFFLLLLFTLCSCENKTIDDSFEKQTIRNVTFELPSRFLIQKSHSVDTEVYEIFYHKKNIGSVYCGLYYKPFVEEYSITEEMEIYNKVSAGGAKIYYTKYLEQDYKNGTFNDNYYYFDTINKNIARVMLPKQPTKGSIGIYFDSIDAHKNKFAIVSNDLSEENKKTFLKIFKTIRINKATH